jgi:hypothetical protein
VREIMWVVRSSISVFRQGEKEEERGEALQGSLKYSESTRVTS